MEKEQAYKFTTGDAENYDFYLGPLIFEPYGEYLATQIDTTNLSSVLELACGSGRVTTHILKVLPNDVEFWATDISGDMLDIAKGKLGDYHINYAVEDIQNLSFAVDTFDLVICQFGLMFLPDKMKGLKEIYRVLKPGGKLMLFTWDDTLNIPLFKLLINDLMLPYFEGEDTTRFFVPFSLHDPQQLAGWLQDTGFKEAESKNIKLMSGNVSHEHIESGIFRKHPLGRQMMDKAPSAYETVAQKLREGITAMYPGENVSSPLSAFLTTGVK
jgi:ubiquinone/menaquinone biosynthesis C-methylase UbiE